MRVPITKAARPSTFAAALQPDSAIKTVEAALANENNVIHTPRVLQDGAFSWSLPEPRKAYRFLGASPAAVADLGLDENDPDFRRVVSGEIYADASARARLPAPYAQAYAGWQFGQFAGQLGDGRALSLFEVAAPAAQAHANRGAYEVQLKGSGKTPYSRFADGKAVLRLSLREYVISEHLHAVGIPTTRALALTYLPQTSAQRHAAEKCAVVARFAPLWVRLGTFDLYRWRFDPHGLRALADYVIEQLFSAADAGRAAFPRWSALARARPALVPQAVGVLTRYDQMYLEIVVRNATTTAMWQVYGFLNGVLNTDNTSVLGLLMDFGPFAILDRFDPHYTPNSEDHLRRYSYANTPTSIWWNLTRLGEDLALLLGAGPRLVDDPVFRSGTIHEQWEPQLVARASRVIEAAGEVYKHAFTAQYVELFFARLGLDPRLVDPADLDRHNTDLIAPLLHMLGRVQCDYNMFFVQLQHSGVGSAAFRPEAFARTLLRPASEYDNYDADALVAEVCGWLRRLQAYIDRGGHHPHASARHNPLFLPRNWILDEVIALVQESDGQDLRRLRKLERMAFNPYDRSKWGDDLKDEERRWMLQSDMGPDYSMLQCSCSS